MNVCMYISLSSRLPLSDSISLPLLQRPFFSLEESKFRSSFVVLSVCSVCSKWIDGMGLKRPRAEREMLGNGLWGKNFWHHPRFACNKLSLGFPSCGIFFRPLLTLLFPKSFFYSAYRTYSHNLMRCTVLLTALIPPLTPGFLWGFW